MKCFGKGSIIVDLHNDTVQKVFYDKENFINGSVNLHIDLPKIRSLKRPCILFSAVWVDPVFTNAYSATLSLLKVLKNTLSQDKTVRVAYFKKNIREINNSNKTAVFITVEGGHSINNSIENLQTLYKEGVRSLTLTHWNATEWAGSANQDSKRGLSKFGFEIIHAMNDLGMIVDVAHASEPTIFDVTKVSKYPIICSHGSAKTVYNSERALSDKAIRAIADNGGLVGVTFFPIALSPLSVSDEDSIKQLFNEVAKIEQDTTFAELDKAKQKHYLLSRFRPKGEIPDLEVVFKHIEYLVTLVGEDHVAMGSDFDGVPYCCRGLEDISKMQNIIDFLEKKGYVAYTIEKILGLNALRFIDTVLK